MLAIEMMDKQFGRWTVIGRGENTPKGQARWIVRCECGNEGIKEGTVLRDGRSQSCGCRKLDLLVIRSTKHGHATQGITPTYHSWTGMVARCTNPKHRSYAGYGGAGVTVCERWLTFSNFLEDMGEKPKGKSIDRKKGAMIYDKDHCRWATGIEQGRNRSNNRFLTRDGVSKLLVEWAEELNINPATLSYRITHGWTDEEALRGYRDQASWRMPADPSRSIVSDSPLASVIDDP